MDRQGMRMPSIWSAWTAMLLAVATTSLAFGADTPPSEETTTLGILTGMGDDTTEHKPQSKVWKHGDSWWSVLSDGADTWLWRLDGTDWTPIFAIDSANDMHADCKRVGNLVHVLLQDEGAARLVSLEYLGGSYQLWSARPSATVFTLGSGVETATIDLDSQGRLWVAYDTSSEVQVRYSDSPYSSFSSPITLENDITTDDIAVVTTLNDGSIGVLWSNQNDDRFGFRRHLDGTSATSWLSNEVPASQSAESVGGGMADDHMNVTVSSNGTLYAAVKTSYDQPPYPKIALLVRRPNGTWDDLYTVDTDGTRPMILLDESASRLRIVYTQNEGSNPIVQRTTSTTDFVFCDRELLLNDVLIDATSTKEVVSGDEVILASRNGTVRGARITSEPTVPPGPVGLVAHWAFEEGSGSQLVDISGNNHTGTISGAAVWTDGVVGQALDLQGGYGIVSDDATLDLKKNLTLAAWVRPSEIQEQSLLKKAITDAADGYELSLSANGYPYVYFNQDTYGTLLFLEANDPYPTNGDWMHLAVTYDSDDIHFYVNGALSASKAAGANIALNSIPFTIGGGGDGADRFSGTIDEARVYDGPLTAVEIAALADEEPPPPPPPVPGLAAHWRFDEGSGSLVIDASPNQNDGSINGTGTWVEGVDNLALDVDGHCTVPDDPSLDVTGEITLAAWLRPDAVTTQYVLKKALADEVDGFELSLSSGGYPFVRFNQASSGNDYRINANSDYPSNGVDWMHVAATYDGSRIRLYVNGILEQTAEITFAIGTNDLAVGLGSQEDGIRPFLGAMDDLRIYDRALTGTEVSDLVESPSTVLDVSNASQPSRLVLAGANPFRDRVSLRVDLESGQGLDDKAAVVIFDATGRHISRLRVADGSSEVSWHTTDDSGRKVPAGVYWAGLQSRHGLMPKNTQRLVVLR